MGSFRKRRLTANRCRFSRNFPTARKSRSYGSTNTNRHTNTHSCCAFRSIYLRGRLFGEFRREQALSCTRPRHPSPRNLGSDDGLTDWLLPRQFKIPFQSALSPRADQGTIVQTE